ncbi:MAG TPA: fatty acid desaturase [Rubrobacteraceae bacterium]|nr:fatty acid desaturase [Rubrobacteraceae bacterium]
MNSDTLVKAKVRADLPPEVFVRRPMRCLLLIPLLGIVIGGSTALVMLPIPWYAALAVSVVVGNFYASMMFLGHEIAHGAIVRSRRLQNLLLYPGCAIFCISPYLWRVWHNCAHHAHTNRPDEDPDNFGTLENFLHSPPLTRSFTKTAPGSGHWLSAIYLFAFFTLQAQSVLWWKSRIMPGYRRLKRKRAVVDSVLLATFWIGVSITTGLRGTLFVVVIPMLVANFVVLSYVVTNHMVRPLSDKTDTLSTTMSVTTFKLLDRIHFHFSHHVEHHLFPAMSSSMTPHVRHSLVQHFGDRYLAPPHWRALLMVYQTPRVYDGPQALIEPYSGRREEIPRVEATLRARQKLPTSSEG